MRANSETAATPNHALPRTAPRVAELEVVRRLAASPVNYNVSLIVLAMLLLSSCATHPTKSWHRALNHPVEPWIGPLQSQPNPSLAEEPPRGPETDWKLIQQVHIGASGDDILRITGQDPFYARECAFLFTYIHHQPYEVAFRYASDHSGRITDISFLPVSHAQIQKSRGPYS